MSNYDWSFKFIPEVSISIEIGSRDLLDANTIQKQYNCKIYSFECNPECLIECKKNLNNENITLVEKAVSQIDGFITFYPFDLNKYDNMGASSMFEIDFSNRSIYDGDYGKSNVQKVTQVPSIRLDTFFKENNIVPDAIFMDVQEAELEVLKSASSLLKNVKFIVTEVATNPTYKGGCDIVDIHTFLEKEGFELISHPISCIERTKYYTYKDLVYKNKMK